MLKKTERCDSQYHITYPTASVVPSGEYRQHNAFVTLATWHGTWGL